MTGPQKNGKQPAAGPTEEQIAEQMRLLAEKEAEKQARKEERLRRLAEKKVERQQRQEERKARMAEKKVMKAAGVSGATSAARARPSAAPGQNLAAMWALVVTATILAMAGAGAAAFFIVRAFV